MDGVPRADALERTRWEPSRGSFVRLLAKKTCLPHNVPNLVGRAGPSPLSALGATRVHPTPLPALPLGEENGDREVSELHPRPLRRALCSPP